MICPYCDYDQVHEQAQHCPRCGKNLRIAAGHRAKMVIRQDVERNLGNVIGVKAQVINGDVYADSIYQVQLYALGAAGRAAEYPIRLPSTTPPYKYLSAYRARDEALFHGRRDKINEVVRRIGEQQLLAVRGPAGVGKTSLLAAGVIPELMRCGAMVVRIQEYAQPPQKTIRAALAASTDQIPIELPTGTGLPGLVEAIVHATDGTFVLILDEFERVFEPGIGQEQRGAIVEGLAHALQAIEPELLRVVVVVDTLERLGRLQDQLPELMEPPIRVEPLTHEEAQLAIDRPLKVLDYPGGASYVDGLVEKLLVPELDRLTPEDPGRIQPTQLQIVCRTLYEKARQRAGPAHIDRDFYVELRRAEGIFHSYMDETLARLGDERALAEHIMRAMALSDIGRWVSPEELPLDGATKGQMRTMLDRLTQAELLDHYAINGRHNFAFASPVVAQEIRKRTDPDVRRRYDAREDLERVWIEWVAHEGVATRPQLSYLVAADPFLSPSPDQVLLLLRSAVARDVSVDPWYQRLRREGEDLIARLEEAHASPESEEDGLRPLDEARRLVGLRDPKLPPRPAESDASYGNVAWSAVAHPKPVVRQTAALALMALGPARSAKREAGASAPTLAPKVAWDRLRWALCDAPVNRWYRWRRRSEVLSALADADEQVEMLVATVPPCDRFGIWGWRVWRQVIRNRNRILALVLGCAFGTGLPLGLFRMLLSIPAGRAAGTRFALNFFWGFILGAAVGLGIGLAEPLLVGRHESEGELPPIWRAPLHPDRLPAVLSVGLGTVFFALAHVLVAWFNMLEMREQALILATGALAGFGVNLGLYGQPAAGWRQKAKAWLLRLGAVALLPVAAQLIVFDAGRDWTATAVTRQALSYKTYFNWSSRLVQLVEANRPAVALLDIIIVANLLLFGMTFGMDVAGKLLARWRAMLRFFPD